MSRKYLHNTLTEQEAIAPKTRSTELDKRYRIEWGQSNQYSVICDDEDTQRSYKRHQKPLTGVFPLNYKPKSYITVGLDHLIQMCSNTGRLLHSLSGHSELVIGLIELSKNRLLSASSDGVLKIWSTKNGTEICSIGTKLESLEALTFFENSEHLAVRDEDGVSIWSFDGVKTASMSGLESDIKNISRLNDGAWLVQAGLQCPAIWSESGQKIYQFTFKFDFKFDLHEVDSDRLIIREPDGSISLWQTNGSLLSRHESSEKISSTFSSLRESTLSSDEHMYDKPEVIDYKHIRNPIGNNDSFFVARAELEAQELDLQSPERKLFWNYFNRPLFNPIKTALKEQISVAREKIKLIEERYLLAKESTEYHLQKRVTSARWSKVFLALFAVTSPLTYLSAINNSAVMGIFRSLIPALDSMGNDANVTLAVFLGGASFLSVLACLMLFSSNRNHKSRQLQQIENCKILEVLEPCFKELINNIKSYRRSLLEQIPVVSDSQVFSGTQIKKAMNAKIRGSIEEQALEECGLEREDIIYEGNQAITMKDWALIQDDDKRKQVTSKLNPSNEISFWSSGGELVFAVEYIQYIFLTEDKIDVFTTYYDYISGKSFGKEANAFYYKDVTNISKREVERVGQPIFNASEISATEITLSVASGEKIRLTLFNEESASALSSSAKDNEDMSLSDKLEQLKQQRQEFTEDTSLDEEELKDELEVIDAEIADLTTQDLQQDVSRSSNIADEAIKNIRSQLRHHKKQDRTNDETLSELQ